MKKHNKKIKNKKNEKLSGLLGAFLSGDVSRLMYDA